VNKNEALKIAIVGDCSNWNQRDLSNSDIDSNILSSISECDAFIFNLEGPLNSSHIPPNCPIKSHIMRKILKRYGKISPLVTSSQSILDVLNITKLNVACLANNHILDAGEEGIDFTLESLKQRGFLNIGAGKSIHDSSKSLILEIKGTKVGILNYNFVGWKKFGIFIDPLSASKVRAGTNSGKKNKILQEVNGLSELSDIVIVIMHIGRQLKKKLSDKELMFLESLQADIVVVHHSHILQTINSKKVFSTGDFIFNFPEELPNNREGAVIYLEYKNEVCVTTNRIRIVQGKPVLINGQI